MVSIQGLPPALIQKQQAIGKKSQVKKTTGSKSLVAQPSKVATAVTTQVKQLNASEYANSRVQYDLPEGRNRHAMEEYMEVMLQKRREELAQLVGVDLYI
ncbi:chromosome partitioning protein ParA [Aliivibrio fischeri]|uniref:chromosome partitioning protein ParA n=1 Tax=Aliivibrio fischeri TaxID=668 RepID=UPI0012D8D389|nr:chromosome partitioning protein ParA [Aliivibrio fischeri]MUI53726.1 chromosome partitioning protein ParA [Aliivibrio fischeri]